MRTAKRLAVAGLVTVLGLGIAPASAHRSGRRQGVRERLHPLLPRLIS